MLKSLSRFFILFGVVLCASVALHAGLKTNFFEEPIPALLDFSYKFNFGITFIFTTTIIILSNRFADQLGYVFLIGSAVKLMAFVFISNLKGFDIDKTVFLDFFIPYVVCVVVEILIITKELKKL